MRLVIQRVSKASVRDFSTNELVGQIEKGLFVLVGIAEGDMERDSSILADKLLKLRIMSDDNGKMNLSIKDVDKELLIVSQFTLIAETKGGNRPSFIHAANPDIALKIYNHFINLLKKSEIKVETGKFGSYMKIEVELDGPVTIILESRELI